MKLIAIDLDGTLLSHNKGVSQANIQAIKDATAQEHVVMICSGRAHEDVLSFQKENDLSLPFGGSNGAVVYADDRIIHSTPMSIQDAKAAFTYLEAEKFPFKIYTNIGIFSMDDFIERSKSALASVPEKEAVFGAHLELLIEHQKKVPGISYTSFEDIENTENLEIYKFFTFTPQPEKKEALISFMETIESLASTSSGPDNVEVMNVNAHKGSGVKQMADYYNIPMEDTVAIGDNFNDVPMLEVAGLSIAMENAEDEVKALCDVTTLTNEEDGVAYAIRKYVLNEEV